MKDRDGLALSILFAVVCGALLAISKAMGCDLATLLRAVPGTIILAVASLTAISRLRLDPALCAAMVATLMWPNWFGIVDSIALGGIDPHQLPTLPVPNEVPVSIRILEWFGEGFWLGVAAWRATTLLRAR
ncbi:hypothetical protein [Roseateles noduli]|uniref:hypothetical protein n=1 Tax=Roseateles noduli TaxID=2052484 RepID=UPI003D65A4FF